MPPYGSNPSDAPEARTEQRRDLYWQNVVRESLMALAVAAGSGGRLSPTPTAAEMSPDPVGDLFDGRVGVITKLGQRIPIADVYPLFACSIPGKTHDRMLSADVQCSVFRIKTPAGESYTLPISQIVAIHSISAELLAELEAAAQAAQESEDGEVHPFGFAAYTSLARSSPPTVEDRHPGA